MPLFQKYSPEARNRSARSAAGFSSKRWTRKTLTPWRWPISGAAMDVAVAGGRERRRDAEGDEGGCVFLGHLRGDAGGPLELVHRLDDVIGRRDQHDGVGIVTGDQGGAQADARRRVAAARLADDVIGRQLRQLTARLGHGRLAR